VRLLLLLLLAPQPLSLLPLLLLHLWLLLVAKGGRLKLGMVGRHMLISSYSRLLDTFPQLRSFLSQTRQRQRCPKATPRVGCL
jgi:hypothetical protein